MTQSKSKNLPLGYTTAGNHTFFRLFAPDVLSAEAVIYENYENETGLHIPLQKNEDGVWEGSVEGEFYGKWYVYLLEHPERENADPLLKYPVADPYSKFVTTRNHHLQF